MTTPCDVESGQQKGMTDASSRGFGKEKFDQLRRRTHELSTFGRWMGADYERAP